MGMMKAALVLVTAGAMAWSGSVAGQEISDWSGFYAGISAGYGIDRTKEQSQTSNIGPLEIDPGTFYTIGQNSSVGRFEGLIGGVGAGYNYQHGQFVLGVDGEISFGNLEKNNRNQTSFRFEENADFLAYDIDETTSFEVDWYSTFSARAGVSFDGWLAYAKGGVAVANVSSNAISTVTVDTSFAGGNGPLPLPPGTYTASASSSQLVFGPTLGVGFEKMVSSNISLGAEYSFIGLPDYSAPQATTLGGLGGLFGGDGSSADSVFKSSIHTVMATLKYHF